MAFFLPLFMNANSNLFKTYFIIALGFLFFNISFSQDKDSLFSVANNQYQSKKYVQAAKNFETLYKLNKKDTIYLYYAASSAVSGSDYSMALEYYLMLDSLNYTGIRKEYFAKSIKKKKLEQFNTIASRDSAIQNKTHKNRKDKWSKSVYPGIIKNIALIYTQLNQNDKALKAIKKARAKNEKEVELIMVEANLNYTLGYKNEFTNLLREAIKLDKKNTDLIYNLGVVSQEAGEFKTAKKYYRKALKIDANHLNSLINLSGLLLSSDTDIVDEMNSLGITKAENKRYDMLLKKRKKLIKKGIPYLKRIIKIDKNNTDALESLKSAYEALGDRDKQKKIEAIINSKD